MGQNCSTKFKCSKIFGGFPNLLTRQRLDEVDFGGGLGRRLAEKCGKGLHLVAGLDSLHIFQVIRIEQLRPIHRQDQLGFGTDHLADAFRFLPFPAGPGDQEIPAIVAGRTAADIVKVVGVEVDELDAEVALLLKRGNGQDHGFGTQIQCQPAIGGIRIGRLHRPVFVGVDAGNILDLVPRSLVIRIVLIHKIAVENAVAVDRRVGIHVGFFGDLSCFLRRKFSHFSSSSKHTGWMPP